MKHKLVALRAFDCGFLWTRGLPAAVREASFTVESDRSRLKLPEDSRDHQRQLGHCFSRSRAESSNSVRL